MDRSIRQPPKPQAYTRFRLYTHHTKKLSLVKEFLGHTSLENTLLYIQIEQVVFGVDSDDEYEVKATNNGEEIKKLLSVGFEYVCQKDDILYFRKRK